MSGLSQYNALHRYSVSGTFGELQVTAAREHVVVDVQSRNYDTVGRLHCEHALAKLPLQTAMRVRDLLDKAIAASADMTDGSPDSWSNATTRTAVPGRVGRRRMV